MSGVEQIAACPLCDGPMSEFAEVRGFHYFLCPDCQFISVDPVTLARIDAGHNIRRYDDAYWQMEVAAAKRRALGDGPARFAELAPAQGTCSIPSQSSCQVAPTASLA